MGIRLPWHNLFLLLTCFHFSHILELKIQACGVKHLDISLRKKKTAKIISLMFLIVSFSKKLLFYVSLLLLLLLLFLLILSFITFYKMYACAFNMCFYLDFIEFYQSKKTFFKGFLLLIRNSTNSFNFMS